ncbi:MAG: helix-turn-helix domain-containing GNAT family N-acetyltransferase [Actinomycetota bacterium]|nr:helix-turn-helix domain-containing GNAT family N-acetyltransferase [Actinomycetota bacterium]
MAAANGFRIEAVRTFNRNYTRAAGLLTERLHDTPHSLTEARILFELGAKRELSMIELRSRIGLDPGYLSRVVSRLERRGLVSKRRSADDGRVQLLSLTADGAADRRILDARSASQVDALLEPIASDRQEELVGAMRTVTGILSPSAEAEVTLRPPGPGDLGWIVQRHGVLFPREYGWGPGFEALIARVIADFSAAADDPGNAAWIAELDGERAGSILCVGGGGGAAKLRLLLVEPFARGHGLGAVLVDECISFARAAGYDELVLWTMEVLVHARPIYERAGFELVSTEKHRMFGPELVGQDWRLRL